MERCIIIHGAILVGFHIICPLAITGSKHVAAVGDKLFIGADTSNALRLLPTQGHGLRVVRGDSLAMGSSKFGIVHFTSIRLRF